MAIHSARRGRGIRSMALYPTWSTSKAAGAPVHCTGDDIMIASLVLLGALLIVGDPRRLQPRFHAVAAVAILGGPAYTVFSEWLDNVIRGSWAYAGAKTRMPFVCAGTSTSTGRHAGREKGWRH